MKTIPTGRSLVLLVGPSGGGKSTFAQEHFQPWEVVSSDAIRLELSKGDIYRMDKIEATLNELHARIRWKLENNQRVVVDATHVRNKDRRYVARIGQEMNAPVIYVVINRDGAIKHKQAGWRANVIEGGKTLIDRMEETFVANEESILSGDSGMAKLVVDTRVDKFHVAQELPRDPDAILPFLLDQGFEYVRVIGDVHGNMDGMKQALRGVDDRGVTFFLFLGDVVDYGKDTLETANLAYHLVSQGQAAMVRGNHERKIARWISNPDTWKGSATHGNNVTMNQLKAMRQKARFRWRDRFLSLVELCPDWIQIGNVMFTHAAVHRKAWNNPIFRAPHESSMEVYSMFGQITGEKDERGYPVRLYDWVDDLPMGSTAVVGHAVLSVDEPVEKRGKGGGRAIMLDTGSSKNMEEFDDRRGHLSWLDFDILEPRKAKPKLMPRRFGRET